MRPKPGIRALCTLCWLLAAALSVQTDAQSLHLSRQSDAAPTVSATVGDTLTVLVRADLGNISASGLSLYVRFSTAAFAVVDGDGDTLNGVQPFTPGSLFSGAAEFDNAIVPAAELPAATDWQLIHYAAVLGPGSQLSAGSGAVVTVALRCLAPVRGSEISIYRSPIHETRLVLADGRSERDFRPAAPLVVNVDYEGVMFASWSSIKSTRDPAP